MNNVLYYVSEHGYGHATRSIAIIREMIKRNSGLRALLMDIGDGVLQDICSEIMALLNNRVY